MQRHNIARGQVLHESHSLVSATHDLRTFATQSQTRTFELERSRDHRDEIILDLDDAAPSDTTTIKYLEWRALVARAKQSEPGIDGEDVKTVLHDAPGEGRCDKRLEVACGSPGEAFIE